jgi:L-alanine-DL-glutamate epimerase-like enolase superfamily enzyme
MRIQSIQIKPLRAALSQPFRISTGQHNSLDNVLFILKYDNHISGFGEAAVATHITGETVSQTIKNLHSLNPWLIGQSPYEYLKISRKLHNLFPQNKAAVAAVETALLDAMTKDQKIPFWRLFGSRPKTLITDITIVIADLDETINVTKKFYKQGFRTFKVKVGKDFDLDINRVLAISKITKKSSIILDANQGFTVSQTLEFLNILNKEGVRPILVEQPVKKSDWGGLKKLTRLSKVPICADESVSSLADAKKAIRQKAVKAINIKFMKTGIVEGQKIALLAKKNGLKLMIGGMMESSLAMTAAAHFAAGLGCFDYIDLDTPFFIKDGLKNNPYLNRRGTYNLAAVEKGVGVAP